MPRLGDLKRYRLERFLSQRDLAEKSGVSTRQIREIEACRVTPHPRTARKLAEALGMHPQALVGVPPRDKARLSEASLRLSETSLRPAAMGREAAEDAGRGDEDEMGRLMRQAMRLLEGP